MSSSSSSSAPLTWPVYPADSYPVERRRIAQAFALFDRDSKKVVLKESAPLALHPPLLSLSSTPLN